MSGGHDERPDHPFLGVARNGAEVLIGAWCGCGKCDRPAVHTCRCRVPKENQRRAAPENAERAVIIGIHDDAEPDVATTTPCAVSLSALTIWIVTGRALGHHDRGIDESCDAKRLIRVAGWAGEHGELHALTSERDAVRCCIDCCSRRGHVSKPRGLIRGRRGPGALANSLPMTCPGSELEPIMNPGREPPFIHPGTVPAPPIIQA